MLPLAPLEQDVSAKNPRKSRLAGHGPLSVECQRRIRYWRDTGFRLAEARELRSSDRARTAVQVWAESAALCTWRYTSLPVWGGLRATRATGTSTHRL